MSVIVVSAAVFLLVAGQVICNCPPSSGIYLMHKGDCYPNGSYFWDINIHDESDRISCMLHNIAHTSGEWVGPDGQPINCYGDTFHCNYGTNGIAINLKRGYIRQNEDGWYKCCLPTNCSDPNSHVITANLFYYTQITDIRVDLPSNMISLPQTYTLHAIRVGERTFKSFNWYYESGNTSIELSCTGKQNGYNCSIGDQVEIHNMTYELPLTITWNGENIASGVMSQSNNNGDHVFKFSISVATVERKYTKTVTAPAASPSSLAGIGSTATTITVSWTVLDLSDADGYVVTAFTNTESTSVQVEGGNKNTATLMGLRGGTIYEIKIRAYQQLIGPASDTISAQTLSDDYCVSETTSSDRGLFEWPNTDSGASANIFCPNGPTGATALRRCNIATWQLSDETDCATTAVSDAFKNLSRVNVTADNVELVIQNLSDLVISVTGPADQNVNNVRAISNLLAQTSPLLSNLSAAALTRVLGSVLQILNSVDEWPPSVIQAKSNELVQSFERIIDALLSHRDFTSVKISESGITLLAERIAKSKFKGREFAGSPSNGSLIVGAGDGGSNAMGVASIRLPQSVINITDGNDNNISLGYTLYNKAVLFPVRDTNIIVGSSVISASIGGVIDGTELPDPVVVSLVLKTKTPINPRCAYWNFTAADGRGNWSTRGCNTTFDPANNSVACHCNHLTNFACLVDISARSKPTQPPEYVTVTLEVVSYIGVCLSLVGLILTIITLLIFKQLRVKDASKFHIQLCLSLFFMLIVFVSGISEVGQKPGCVIVGLLIHYFTLVAWMWMGAEAVLMFQKVVIVFVTTSWRYHALVSGICWGVPLVPVVILLAVDHNYYVALYEDGSGFCFIRELVPLLLAFLCPILLVLVFNAVLYVIIICTLIRHTSKKLERMKTSLSKADALKMIASFISISILFGLTWIFAVFTFVTEPAVSFVIQFFFALVNILQGFFIFFFFVVLSKDSRNAWKDLFFYHKFRESKAPKIVFSGVGNSTVQQKRNSLPKN